jgi:hypothetical protein
MARRAKFKSGSSGDLGKAFALLRAAQVAQSSAAPAPETAPGQQTQPGADRDRLCQQRAQHGIRLCLTRLLS